MKGAALFTLLLTARVVSPQSLGEQEAKRHDLDFGEQESGKQYPSQEVAQTSVGHDTVLRSAYNYLTHDIQAKQERTIMRVRVILTYRA
jgi:hypothetical protein